MDYTRGELEEIQAGVFNPAPVTTSFDGTPNNGKISTAAAMTTALTGSNNDMVFTAKTAGIAGNNITIEYIDLGYDGVSLSVSASTTEKHIKVQLARSAGAITTTAAQVKTAIEADTAANALVSLANAGGNDGTGLVTAMAATNLSGGSDGTVDLFTVEQDGLVAVYGDCTEDLTGTNATIEVGTSSSTAGLIPQTTATTLDNTMRIHRNGVIATTVAPNITPFFPVRAGDVIQVKVGTATVTDGTVKWRLFYKQFSENVEAKNSVSGTLQSSASATGNGKSLTVLGQATAIVTISGTYTGLSLVIEGTEDGTNWSTLNATQLGTSVISSSIATNGVFQASVAGLQTIRARIAAISTGSVTVTAHAVPVTFTARTIDAWTSSVSGNSTVTQIASSATNVTLQAANASRKELIIYNDSTAILYVKFGATASTTSYTVQLFPNDTHIEDKYTGRVDGVWSAANGNALITEIA